MMSKMINLYILRHSTHSHNQPSNDKVSVETPEYKLYEAHDGLDAIIKMHNCLNKIHIVFIDNIMPNITGTLATKLLRGLGYNRLIIGVTGNGLEKDVEEFYQSGADHIFIKPFSKGNMELIFDFVKKNSYERKEGMRIVKNDKELVWQSV